MALRIDRMVLIDLHHRCSQVQGSSSMERVSELAKLLPFVSMSALGGFPFLLKEDLQWVGGPATIERLQHHVLQALGTSAVLTYTNRGEKTLEELGELCTKRNHLWGLHWISATLVFARHPPAVELAFARDTRFRMSWPVEEVPSHQVFAATGSLKDWMTYVAHQNDPSFDKATRCAMDRSYHILKLVLP